MTDRHHPEAPPAPDGLGWPTVWGVYLLAAYVYCFHGLSAFGVAGMEGMVVDGARGMIETGNWIVPHLYGQIYTFKPALTYWIAAVPLLAVDPEGPIGTLALRAPFALTGALLGAGVLVLVASRLGRRAGLLCALAAMGTPLFIEKVRLAEYDTPLTVLVGIAVAAACVNLSRSRPGASLWVLAYLALAGGFLAKGLPALMAFGPGLLLAAVLTGQFRKLWSPQHLLGVALFAAVAGAYLVAVHRIAGAQAFEQPLGEAGRRGFEWTLDAMLRTAAKPALIFAAFLPWSLLLLAAGGVARRSDAHGRVVRSAGAFLLGGMLAFILTPTHEMRYYLPLVASLALVCGATADRLLATPLPWRHAKWVGQVVAGLSLLLLLTTWVLHVAQPLGSTIALALGSLGLLALLTWRWTDPTRRLVGGLVALSLFVAVAHADVFVVRRAMTRELSSVAAAFDEHLPAQTTIWIPGPVDPAGSQSSLYFYLDRRVRTFPEKSPPPPGSFVVLIDDQQRSYPADSLTRLHHVTRRWHRYELARVR